MSTGQHRPQHPHIQRGAGGVHTLEERARADRPGESGTPQKCQGPVEAGVGHGQNREHVRLLTTFWSAGLNFGHMPLAIADSDTLIRPLVPVLFRDLQIFEVRHEMHPFKNSAFYLKCCLTAQAPHK